MNKFILIFTALLALNVSAQEVIMKSGFEDGEQSPLLPNSIHVSSDPLPAFSPVVGAMGVIVFRGDLFNNTPWEFHLWRVSLAVQSLDGGVFPFRNVRLRFVPSGHIVHAATYCSDYSCFGVDQQGMAGMAALTLQEFEVLADVVDVSPSVGRRYVFRIVAQSDIYGTTYPLGNSYVVGGVPAPGPIITPRL